LKSKDIFLGEASCLKARPEPIRVAGNSGDAILVRPGKGV